jgi:aldehyde dehydrogenase (NAD+)
MADATRFYIGGHWVQPHKDVKAQVINPATTQPCGSVALGSSIDAEVAIAAARVAFKAWSRTSREERLSYLRAIYDALVARNNEIADAITDAMGAPLALSRGAQAPSGPQHFGEVIRVLEQFRFEEMAGSTLIRHEPIGVCVLITPWNWPMNQIATKVPRH